MISIQLFLHSIIEETRTADGNSHMTTSHLMSVYGIFKPATNHYESIFCLTNDSLVVVDVKESIILHIFPISEYHCFVSEHYKTKSALVLSKLVLKEDCSLLYGQIEQYLHCSQTDASSSNTDTNMEEVQEIIIDTEQVETFISLFTRTRKYVENPKEYFVM